MDTKELYEIYKEYAWREYDLLEKRANWLYITNSLFVAGLYFGIQEALKFSSGSDAVKEIGNDAFLQGILFALRFALVAIPFAAIVFNGVMWRIMYNGFLVLEGVRIQWRDVKTSAPDGNLLPFVAYGFRDMGPAAKGFGLTRMIPISLILFWIAVGGYGVWLLH